MEIKKEQYKALLTTVVGKLKRLETELMAYRLMIYALKQVELHYPYDEAFRTALGSPQIARAMNAKYDGFLDIALKTIDENAANQELLKFLKEWNPEGPVN